MVKFDAVLPQQLDLSQIGATAREWERAGCDGVWMGEARSDVMLPLLLAANDTEAIRVSSGVAIAFARSPMSLAYAAHDLHRYSRGRFVLGIGSQTRPHIERRFSMPWSSPIPRMREYIAAMRAVWTCWNTGDRLAFDGEFYQLNLMTDTFAPPPDEFGPPAVHLAAVGPAMTRLAAEAADGIITHPFATRRYQQEVTRVLIDGALDAASRQRSDLEVVCQVIAVSGPTEEALAESAATARSMIAFYASTPSYRAVMELHGWSTLADDLHQLSRQQRWQEMTGLIDDEVLTTFAVVAPPDGLAGAVIDRVGDFANRITFSETVRGFTGSHWAQVIADLTEAAATSRHAGGPARHATDARAAE